MDNGDGNVVTVTSPDPGVMLSNLPEFPPFLPKEFTANFFKTPQLWGVENTAPYFHDNSAKSLEELAEQYAFFFEDSLALQLSPQDRIDMVAFLKLL